MQSSGEMWKLEVCVLCLIFCSRAWSWSFWDTAEEPEPQPDNQGVKIEVLFKPEPCAPKSKRGDLMNVHYDGFLAEDGSQFYCRSALSFTWFCFTFWSCNRFSSCS